MESVLLDLSTLIRIDKIMDWISVTWLTSIIRIAKVIVGISVTWLTTIYKENIKGGNLKNEKLTRFYINSVWSGSNFTLI